MSSFFYNSLLNALVAVVLAPMIVFAASPKQVKSSDPGFLFQDEVTKEIVIDVHRDHPNAINPFDDLNGKFKRDSNEYRALLLAAGITADTVFKTDENVGVKSLKDLRLKFNLEFEKLSMAAVISEAASESAAEESTVDEKPKVTDSQAVSVSFSIVSEAGFTDPKLGDYRLIPLERGLMMAGVSGEKRVFSNRNVLKDDVFKVALGSNENGERILAVFHEAKLESGNSTVWLLAFDGKPAPEARIIWTKTLEFKSDDQSRTMASGPSNRAATVLLSGESVSVSIGEDVRSLAVKTGEPVGISPSTGKPID